MVSFARPETLRCDTSPQAFPWTGALRGHPASVRAWCWPSLFFFRASKATLGSGHTPLPTAVVGRSYLLCCYAVRTCWSPAWTSRLSPSLVLWPLLLRGSEAGCKDFTWGTLPVLCLQLFIFILFGLALSVIMHKTIVQDRFRISALSRQKCHQQLEHWDQY